MANPTNPFSWQMPTASDLVTDLPADFEVFGQAVATSLQDLLGGTTGQVLAKATNTNMDFTWVTPDDANAIQNAIVDAKGDLIAATAADTPARLAVGTNGQVLTADSTAATGLAWATPVTPTKSFNYIINGGMDISQRGTSFVPTSGIYTLDRWFGQRYGSAGGTVSQVNTSDTTNLPQITKAMRIANNSGATATNTLILNSLENTQTQQLLGQTVAISFYLRKGANYSGADFTVALAGGTGTDESLNAGYTGQATLLTVTAVPTTSWVRYQGTVTVGATYTQLGLVITSKGTGTAGANDWAEITGVQLELGSIATAFERSGGTIQGELAACQRYYFRNTGDTSVYNAYGTGSAQSATSPVLLFQMPVTMRVEPTSLDFSGLAVYDGVTISAVSSAVISNANSGRDVAWIDLVSTGLTTSRSYTTINNNNLTGYIGVSAEL